MSPSDQAAFAINGQAVSAQAFYAVACDPQQSVAVEACAGAGKTWMLVSRVLRALLAGVAPDAILAITFTKKAAGEMRERLVHWLSEFTRARPEQREHELMLRGLSEEQARALQEPLARLYADLLASGRTVQIRTFHSWFAALLRAAPRRTLEELGLPWQYELLEDDAPAIAHVWRRFYAQLARSPQSFEDFQYLVSRHGRSNTRKALENALSKRTEFLLADREQLGGSVLARSVPDAASWMQSYAHTTAFVGLTHPVAQLLDAATRARWMAWAKLLGEQTNATPIKAAQAIINAYQRLDGQPQAPVDVLEDAFAILRKGFFVASEDRLTRHLQNDAAAQEAEAELQRLSQALAQHQAWCYHHAMARLTRVLIACYAELKRERGWVDMNDIEWAALHLLSDSELSAWVQERLDARISHLLIDEFQDTNPLQWHALSAWLMSYVGDARRPSVFIVGDPKQSIYRFRRAEPQIFKDAQALIREFGGSVLSCDHTRRNAPAIVEALNQTFMAAQQAQAFEDFRPHTTASTASGQVGRLPVVPRLAREQQAATGWRDTLNTPRTSTEPSLRAMECAQAAGWVAAQLQQGWQAQDIMVLARKRDRLSAMRLALQGLGIAANLVEKKDLTEAPEIRDLLALLDVLVSPAHNLSLAQALKSPLWGLGDEALLVLARLARLSRRKEVSASWWQLLSNLEHQAQQLKDEEGVLIDEHLLGQLHQAYVTLSCWQGWLAQWPPHDALSQIYHDGDVMARFLAAASPTARDAVKANLQALLSASLSLDGARFLTPYALVRALKAAGVQAPPRQLDQAVQLLTVHGAKGLEAPCVLLLDTDAKAPAPPSMSVLIDWPGSEPAPRQFVFLASERQACPSVQDLLAHEQAARAREELNSLYVAMTRAKTQLLVSAVEPHQATVGTWWQRVPAPALPEAVVVPAPGPRDAGDVLIRTGEYFHVPVLPELLVRQGATAPDAAQDDALSRIGQAMHRLLEWAPLGGSEMAHAQIQRVALAFDLTEVQVALAAQWAQNILHGQGAWAWDVQQVDWHANEVPVVIDGQMHRLDRLVRRTTPEPVWWVIDYKSANDPQAQQALRVQLGQYRDAVRALYPGQTVRAAFFSATGDVQELE